MWITFKYFAFIVFIIKDTTQLKIMYFVQLIFIHCYTNFNIIKSFELVALWSL